MTYCMTQFLTTERPTPDIVVSDDKGDPVDSGPYIPFVTEMRAGFRIDETTVPKPSWLPTRGLCTSAHKSLPDAYYVAGYCCVSQRFRDIIDQFDPGIHQFFPLLTRSKKGFFQETTQFLLNVCILKDTIDVDTSDFKIAEVKGKRFVLSRTNESTLRVLKSNSIPGCVWREEIHSDDLYLSDEVFRAALAVGISGMRVRYIIKTGRS